MSFEVQVVPRMDAFSDGEPHHLHGMFAVKLWSLYTEAEEQSGSSEASRLLDRHLMLHR